MSRRDKKRQAYGGMIVTRKQPADSAPKGTDQKVCGTCKNYSESAFASDGRGSCNTLKMGSDISSDPPVYEFEGKEGFFTRTLSDASGCKHYEKMKLIDKDGYECSDPQYRRTIRQLQDK